MKCPTQLSARVGVLLLVAALFWPAKAQQSPEEIGGPDPSIVDHPAPDETVTAETVAGEAPIGFTGTGGGSTGGSTGGGSSGGGNARGSDIGGGTNPPDIGSGTAGAPAGPDPGSGSAGSPADIGSHGGGTGTGSGGSGGGPGPGTGGAPGFGGAGKPWEVDNSGGITNPPIADAEVTSEFALLLGSLVFWCLSMYFVYQSAALQKWAMTEEEPEGKFALDASSGVITSWLVSAASLLIWFLYLTNTNHNPHYYSSLRNFLTNVFIIEPLSLLPAILIASAATAFIGSFKFWTAVTMLRVSTQTSPAMTRSPFTAFVGVIYTVVTFAASVLGLYVIVIR